MNPYKANKDFRANIYLRFAFPAKKHQEEKKMSNQCFPQEHYIHYVRGHPYITSAKIWVVSEKWQFLLIISTIYADRGRCVQKKQKKMLT